MLITKAKRLRKAKDNKYQLSMNVQRVHRRPVIKICRRVSPEMGRRCCAIAVNQYKSNERTTKPSEGPKLTVRREYQKSTSLK